MTIHVGREWNTVQLVAVDPGSKQGSTTSGGSLEGIVSPAFRQVRRAPFLKLTASPGKGESPAFGTTFSGLVRA
jgi:hypothetical protein